MDIKTQKSSANGEVWEHSSHGRRDVDVEEAGPIAGSAGPDLFIVQLAEFEHFTACSDSSCCRQLCSAKI